MDNFRRRVNKKQKKKTGTFYAPSPPVINSWNPPYETVREFHPTSSLDHYIAEENITIHYDIYDKYDDGTLEYVGSGSWTGDVYPIIVMRTKERVGPYSYSAATRALAGDYFIVELLMSNWDASIYKSDPDGTLVEYELYMNSAPAEISGYYSNLFTGPFGKVTLIKQGASGEGNVLQRCESYT